MGSPAAVKVIYLAHPLGSADPERTQNIERALRWYRWLVRCHDVAVVADWLLTALTHDESHRTLGVRLNSAVLPRVDEVWLCGGHVSPGMAAEAIVARNRGIEVVSCLHLGEEPPSIEETPSRPGPQVLPDDAGLLAVMARAVEEYKVENTVLRERMEGAERLVRMAIDNCKYMDHTDPDPCRCFGCDLGREWLGGYLGKGETVDH